MFLVDYNGDLIDVPVLITNVQSNNGDTPNADPNNQANWILTRRFFIYDTISGIKNGEYDVEGAVPVIIRYAKSISIQIRLDPNNEEMIYVPLLQIEYRERTDTYIA